MSKRKYKGPTVFLDEVGLILQVDNGSSTGTLSVDTKDVPELISKLQAFLPQPTLQSRADAARARVDAMPPSQRVNVGCDYVPGTGEIDQSAIKKLRRSKVRK